jgi:hypothetical protein
MKVASGIDLHSHSTASDGVLSPKAWAELAHANGAELVALTDHDTVAGVAAARAAAAAHGVAFVSGVEISVSFADETIHLVGLAIDETHPKLLAGLESVRTGRLRRAQAIARELEACGFAGAWEGVVALAGSPQLISRAHFARFLVATGRFRSVGEVFAHYLTRGKPGYVAHEWATLTDAVAWIRAAGGVAVLAHPGRYRLSEAQLAALLEDFVAAGGEAIEVVTSAHDAAQTERWARICRRYRLLASQGSDFHSPDESSWTLGQVRTCLPADLEPVWNRLFSRR